MIVIGTKTALALFVSTNVMRQCQGSFLTFFQPGVNFGGCLLGVGYVFQRRANRPPEPKAEGTCKRSLQAVRLSAMLCELFGELRIELIDFVFIPCLAGWFIGVGTFATDG